MKSTGKLLIASFALLFISSCSLHVTTSENTSQKAAAVAKTSQETAEPAKNIILMVGDGMGLTQISSGVLRADTMLNIEQFEYIGLSKTRSSAELITDSAAGATAFSIGEKTYNGAIGVDANGEPKENIVETLFKEGYSSGLIATCRITHATPASFFSHQKRRSMGYEIAADMLTSPIDVFVGGGRDHFVNRTNADDGAVDDRDIVKELEEKSEFSFVNNLDALEKTAGKVGYFTAEGHPPSIINGRDDILPRSVKPVARKLKRMGENGFFLLVEGSQIDWGGHANDSEYIITEMLDFDQAIGEALSFAKKDGNTLVIITADHETGGYSLQSKNNDYNQIEGSFTTGGHTATMVPVFAYGPGAEQFQGVYGNHKIYEKMRTALKK